MAVGEAAGMAAVMSLEVGVSLRDVDVERLKQRLVSKGAIL
jgi:hypothetical protein